MVEDAIRDPGEVIKERLKELGLSQAKFSKMVGKSPGWAAARFLPNVFNMLRYFAYKEPQTIDKILRALQWSPEEFAEATGIEIIPAYYAEEHLTTATISPPRGGRYERASDEEIFGSFIKKRREELGISQEELALRADVSPSLVAKIEQGRHDLRNVKLKNLYGLLRALEWTPEEFAEATGLELPGVSREPKAEDLGMPVEVYTLPLIQAGAGPPWYQDEAETVTLALPELKYPRDKLFVVRIVGDSMSPYLEEGDLAVVYQDPGLAAKGKAVAVWLADDGVVIKRFLGETEDGLLYLGNDNPTHAPFLAPPGSRIVGVVVKRVKEG